MTPPALRATSPLRGEASSLQGASPVPRLVLGRISARCEVRSKTPGPIKISWELALALAVALATRRPPAFAGLGGFYDHGPSSSRPTLLPSHDLDGRQAHPAQRHPGLAGDAWRGGAAGGRCRPACDLANRAAL